ncbi:MAG: hypothetical protein KGZ63_01960 [Clostridiales bacterium]|jgi:hypothetical protein|nr:hypothetical protein [Clostridiales bacterium]
MDKMPLITLLLLAIPEGMLLASVGLTLMGIRPRFQTILSVSILYSISAFIIRKLPLSFGYHSIFIFILMSIYLCYFFKVSYKESIAAAFLGFVFLVAAESLFLPLITTGLSITYEMILGNSWLRILVSIPQQLFLLTVFLVAYYLRGYHKQYIQ